MNKEIINASGKVGINVILKLCLRKGILQDWKTSVMVTIYKQKEM